MTCRELATLESEITLVIEGLSPRLINYSKDAVKVDYKCDIVYMYGSEKIDINRLRVATREDIEKYINNQYRKVLQLRDKLLKGLKD